MTEHRRFIRTPLGQAVDFATKELEFALRMDGVAKDISLGGMFISTDFPTRIGEDVVIHLTLPGGKYDMALPAIVRWTRDGGMGVQFGQLGARVCDRADDVGARMQEPDLDGPGRQRVKAASVLGNNWIHITPPGVIRIADIRGHRPPTATQSLSKSLI